MIYPSWPEVPITRMAPFTEKERMSVLCKKTVDYFEVRVPKYRSPAVSLINIFLSAIN